MVSNPDSNFQSVWGTPWEAVTPFDEPEKVPQGSDIVKETLAIVKESGTYADTTPVSETLNMITADLSAIKSEIIANIVLGKISVEDGLAEYKTKAEKLEVAKVLEEMNAN